MPQSMIINRSSTTSWKPRKGVSAKSAGQTVVSFLDTATTSMGRATHYNTREEQQTAELAAHESLFKLSRDLYTAMMGLPGLTDRAIQVGLKNLLSSHREDKDDEFLRPEHERNALTHLMQGLPPQRMLKLIQGLKIGDEALGLRKANNNRTRKLILRTLLNSDRLALWAVKYRGKMREALVHAWGQKMSRALLSILSKNPALRADKENRILKDLVIRHIDEVREKEVLECIRFILGGKGPWTLKILKAHDLARTDLKSAAKAGVPLEVLEGFRARFHKGTTHSEVVALVATDGRLSKGQKMAVQRQATEAGVKVEMDPMDYDPVRLYLYAFEMGLDEKIQAALEQKARKAAAGFPSHYGRVGIIVDASASMAGDETQNLRPMAATLALRDMLRYVGDTSVIEYVGGQMGQDNLVRPQGDTSLADGLVRVLQTDPAPDAVFVLSDGYENAPAGRFAEVVEQVRELGIDTPIYHLNTVYAAESGKTRELAPGKVTTMPVNSPAALGSSILRGLIESEPIKGINVLIGLALNNSPAQLGTGTK